MPALPQSLSSLRAQTANNLVLDAGLVYVNGNINALRASGLFADLINPLVGFADPNGTIVYPRPLGATRGGNAIGIGRSERQVEADGRRTRIKGLSRTDMVEPMLKLKLLEMADPITVRQILGSTTVNQWPVGGPFQYDEFTPDLLTKNTDYVGNICVAATASGETQPVLYVLDNARVDQIAEMNLVDHNEQVVEATFYGHALLGAPLNIPIHILIPTFFHSAALS
jgi:hypothetical protein